MIGKLDVVDPADLDGGLVIIDLVALAEDELAGRGVLAWTYTAGGPCTTDANAA